MVVSSSVASPPTVSSGGNAIEEEEREFCNVRVLCLFQREKKKKTRECFFLFTFC